MAKKRVPAMVRGLTPEQENFAEATPVPRPFMRVADAADPEAPQAPVPVASEPAKVDADVASTPAIELPAPDALVTDRPARRAEKTTTKKKKKVVAAEDENKSPTTIYLPKDLKKKLKLRAAIDETTMSDIVEGLLMKHLK